MVNYRTSFLSSYMKSKYLLWSALLVLVIFACTAFSFTFNEDFDLARRELLLRKIGHELLLNAGDSTSRVLPIKKTAENEYQIRFENEFTFQTDSLVKIIRRSLTDHKIAPNYIVNVLNCANKEVIYGYAIFKLEKDDIVACSGRKQIKGCYLVEIKFKNVGITNTQKSYLLGGLNLLVIGLIASRLIKRQKKQETIVAECF
jgi:hypothetical protein